MPVGVTNWQIYYSPQYFVSLRDGTWTRKRPRRAQFFALSFWRKILHWRAPRWTAWESLEPPVPVRLKFAQRAERAAAQQEAQQAQGQQLVAEEMAARAEAAKEAHIGSAAIPEGALLKLNKLGGSARAVLAYRGVDYLRFASRTVFLLAVVIGLWLARRPSKRALLCYVARGLALGTVLPPALGWQSPLLAVPFCEGLSLVGLLLLAALAWRGLRTVWRQRQERRAGVAQAGCAGVSPAGSAGVSPARSAGVSAG